MLRHGLPAIFGTVSAEVAHKAAQILNKRVAALSRGHVATKLELMTVLSVFLTCTAFFFIAGAPSGRGITFWAILLYGSPIVLMMAAVSVVLGAPAKRRLIRRQSSSTEFIRWMDLIPSLIFDAVSITGSLIFTVYALEEWLEVGSTYHGDGWMVVFLIGSALLSSSIMIVVHMRLLSRTSGERRPTISVVKRVSFAFQLGPVNPGVFAVVCLGLLWAFPK